jgi:hypothetical protein
LLDEKYYFFTYLFIANTGVWTQGLTLGRQVLYHLSHPTNPLNFKKQETSFFFFPAVVRWLVYLN